MANNKKPRKPYKPRQVIVNTMDLAMHRAAKPAKEDRAEVLNGLRAAVKALREGVATELQWSIAAGSLAVSLAIEKQGKVRGLAGHLQIIEHALQDIYDRALLTGGGRWIRVTLRFNEIEAINDLVFFQKLQMDQLGRAEFMAAIEAAQKDTIAQGHTVAVVRDLERLAA